MGREAQLSNQSANPESQGPLRPQEPLGQGVKPDQLAGRGQPEGIDSAEPPNLIGELRNFLTSDQFFHDIMEASTDDKLALLRTLRDAADHCERQLLPDLDIERAAAVSPWGNDLARVAPRLAKKGIRTLNQLESALATNSLEGPGFGRVRLKRLTWILDHREFVTPDPT